MKKIALLEFNTSHIELLYSQALFLEQHNYQVHLLCDARVKERVVNYQMINSFVYLDATESKYQRFLNIKKYLKKHNIQTIVINTAAWSVIKYLPFMLLGVEVIGITHGLEKLKTSFSQKILSLKIRKYFVLSEHLYEESRTISSIKSSYFYAIFFQKYHHVSLLHNKGDQFWICIPGHLEYKRRDYLSLIEHLPKTLDKRIKFILLGPHNHPSGDGEDLQKRLAEKEISEHFIFFDDFIDDALFHSYLEASDIFMPLLPKNSRYLNNAISGTFNLAYAHKKVQLMPMEYKKISEFQSKTLFYKEQEIDALLLELLKDDSLLKDKEEELNNDEKLTLQYQADNYVHFIEV